MAGKLLNISRSKKLRILAAAGVCFFGALFIYFPNYAKLEKLKRDNRELILENKLLEEEIADYEDKIKRVGNDPYIYEKIAREDLGVARENEIVIDIIR